MKKTIKGIFIDTDNKQITEVQIEPTLESYYKLLNVELIEVCAQDVLSEGSFIYVDEEGLFKPGGQFYVKGANQPYAGNGIMLCLNNDGEDVDVNISLETAKQNIQFI